MTEPTDDLQRRCAECIEWQRTGKLRQGALREYAAKHWQGHYDSLQMAERATACQAMEVLARWGAAPTTQAAPAAQGDALDAAFEAVRHRLCGMQRYSFVLDDDDIVRRVQDRTGNWIEFDAAHELFDPVAVDAARSQAMEGGA